MHSIPLTVLHVAGPLIDAGTDVAHLAAIALYSLLALAAVVLVFIVVTGLTAILSRDSGRQKRAMACFNAMLKPFCDIIKVVSAILRGRR
ncbi:hypothetical protein [Microbispora sp. NPDC046933]|uniref:hypothetical protein n=1 Tax=Microbispora sp. NPDC046933 TaxID=3155618 RepID=UPI0033E08EF1